MTFNSYINNNKVLDRIIFAINEAEICKTNGNMETANKWWLLACGLVLDRKKDLPVKFIVETQGLEEPHLSGVDDLYYDLYTIEVEGMATCIPVPILDDIPWLQIAFERNRDEFIEKRTHNRQTEGSAKGTSLPENHEETWNRCMQWFYNEWIGSDLKNVGIDPKEYRPKDSKYRVPYGWVYIHVADGNIVTKMYGQPYDPTLEWRAARAAYNSNIGVVLDDGSWVVDIDTHTHRKGEDFRLTINDLPIVNTEPLTVPEGEVLLHWGGGSFTLISYSPGQTVTPFYPGEPLKRLFVGQEFWYRQTFHNSDHWKYVHGRITNKGIVEKEVFDLQVLPDDAIDLRTVKPSETRFPFPIN